MARTKSEIATYRPLMVRLPPDVHEAFRDQATKHRRSLNAQIVKIVEDWLAQEHAAERAGRSADVAP